MSRMGDIHDNSPNFFPSTSMLCHYQVPEQNNGITVRKKVMSSDLDLACLEIRHGMGTPAVNMIHDLESGL